MHTLALNVDEYGNVTRSASIAYARRSVPTEYPEQKLLATLTETEVINKDNEADWYRIGVPEQTRTYQLTGISTTQSALLLFADVETAADAAVAIAYEETPTGTTYEKRLVEHVRQKYYDSDSLATTPTALAFGAVDILALPYETYALAFTPGLLTDAFGARVTSPIIEEGGYIEVDDVYWLPTGREVFDPAQFYLPVEVIDVFGNSTTIEYDTHSLLVESVEDALGNTVEIENDYRVLGPVLVTDPNGNRGAAKIDELGMVIATAVMGKVGGSDGDTLEDPTTTFEYDLERWHDDGLPNVVHSAAREKHGDSESAWQHIYTYLDGLGGELMKKVQAEPGLAPVRDEITGELEVDLEGELVLDTASPRWVGTGRVVLDNKGNPVKQYEPFFSATHEYEDETILVEWGVTPILRYDALGRLMRTEMPDGSVSRVEFTPWQQSTWDGNDTVLDDGNAWFAARQSAATPTPSAQDQRAATLTEAHAGTAAVVHFDVLGRPVVGIEDNGGTDQYSTRAKLDIEGNPITITDAQLKIPSANKFDLLGRTLYTSSCDAGVRWTFTNAVGNPIRGWDSRDHVIRSVYDELHRRTELWVAHDEDPEVLAEQTVYGESQADPEVENLRGKVYQVKDGAGVVTNVSYDFKGNLLVSQRQLAQAYITQLDWSGSVTLEAETFSQTTEYDALNRPISMTMPDTSEIKPSYNEAGLLDGVEARIRGAVGWTTFVDDIDYDAKGQRERIEYGNGVYTEYSYDPFTYQVKRIKTTRTSDSAILQDLRYTYDAVGNIVEMANSAQNSVYHDSQLVEPVWKYEYDALYRLINATGREHSGTSSDIQQDAYGFPLVNGANPNDPSAMRNYEESYEYDEVGNILKMIHDAHSSVGDWTRHYHVAETSNRLLDTSLPGDDEEDAVYSAEYTHDAHGNMLTMPHLDGIEWDFKDQMRSVDKGGGGEVFFTYDASGQRVRKVWEHSGIVEERIYLGGFELYRRRESGDIVLERETLHIMDDTRRIAMVETKTIDEAADPFTVTPRIRYQCSNHLGSAMLELDDAGLVISYEEYHPYGTSAYRAVDDSVEVSARRYRYTGKERDEETGLYYHGARYYACWLGRWTSADPAGMVDGPNLFQYVRGRPVGSVDPSGMQAAPSCNVFPNPDSLLPTCPSLPVNEATLDSPSQRKPPGPRKSSLDRGGEKIGAGAPEWLSKEMAKRDADEGSATTTEAVGAFAKGAAKGLATGIVAEVAIAAGAAAIGVSVGAVAAVVGIVALPFLIYGIASNWDEITAGVDRLRSGTGTVGDYEAAGDVAGGLLSLGASKPAGAVGKEIGEGIHAGVRSIGRTVEEALASSGPRLAPMGAPESLLDNAGALETRGGGASAGSNAAASTPKGRILSDHAAKRASQRKFSPKAIDDIIDNNRATRVGKMDEQGRKTWEYRDKRGNKVVVNESDEIVTLFSPAEGGIYIPKPQR